MSVDAMENSVSFDVEAQQSLLTETRGLLSEDDEYEHQETRRGVDARQALLRVILVLRSTEIFMLGADYHFNASSPVTPHHQDSEIAEITSDSTHEDGISTTDYSAAPDQTVELNIQQRKSICDIVRNKNLHELHRFGRVEGIAEALNTDLENGISSPKQIIHSHPTQLYKFIVILFHSFLKASNNCTIFLLSTAAILSLSFGVNQDDMHGFGWFNGVVLISNVFFIIIVTTTHKCWQEWTSIKKLDNSWHSNLRVLTVRGGGNCQLIGEIDIVVGDIVILRKGDQVPGDGLFIITTGDQLLELNDGSAKSIIVDENNPFLFYGSRVVNGGAKMLVTATRTDTVWGGMMSQAMLEETNSKLEYSIHNLNLCVHISGLLISILIIIVLFLRYRAGKMDDERKYRPDPKGEPTRVITITDAIMGIVRGTKGTAGVLTTLLSLSLLGITEGVPVVISFATIIWGGKMLGDKATASDNLACLKMASVTTICTERFGGLTMHKKEIEKIYVGEDIVSESSVVASQVLEVLCDGISMQLLIPHTDSESAILVPEVISWAQANLGLKIESVVEQCKMRRYRGHNPFEERCEVLMEKNGNNDGYLHFSGPPLDILSLCSHHYDINGELKEIDGQKRNMLAGTIYDMLAEEARVVPYAYKGVVVQDLDEEALLGDPQPNDPDDLKLLAMISLKEVKIEDTKEAVSTMLGGGVRTILASGDDISVLEPIGRNCGLIATGSEDHQALITGEKFRSWSDEERMEKLDKICILGNCIPSDKILLIKCLRKKGHVVALLAQRTIDAPALKQADTGLTFGTWSSQVARECSDISIWDFDCFSFMVDAIKSGRCFQDNIRKFIQLQLVFTISSTLINFIAVVSLGDAPITPVQLFWLNLVVALFGGLALLAGPTMKISTMPVRLITKAMWRNIAIQTIYQITIFMILLHKGQDFLGTSAGRIKSAIYNGFFLCQLLNLLIARETEKKNIFGGLFRNNFWFWVAFVIFAFCQGVFGMAEIFLGNNSGLNLELWGACLLVGLISLLLDFVGKCATTFYYKLVPRNEPPPPASNALNTSNMSV